MYVKNSPLRYRDPTGAFYCDPTSWDTWWNWLETGDDPCNPDDWESPDILIIGGTGGGGGSVSPNSLKTSKIDEDWYNEVGKMLRQLATTIAAARTARQDDDQLPWDLRLIGDCYEKPSESFYLTRRRTYEIVDRRGIPIPRTTVNEEIHIVSHPSNVELENGGPWRMVGISFSDQISGGPVAAGQTIDYFQHFTVNGVPVTVDGNNALFISAGATSVSIDGDERRDADGSLHF